MASEGTVPRDGLRIDPVRTEVLSFSGPSMLVEGPAGCGKTTLAVEKVAGTIEDGQLRNGQKVLCVSFSRASRYRMSEALTERLGEAMDEHVLVSTFDSLSLTLVRKYGDIVGASAPVCIEPDTQLSECVRDLDACYLSFEALREKCVDVLCLEAITRIYALLYPVVVVDEFQDTREQHYRILEAMATHGAHLWAFGDTEQDINPGREDAFEPHRALSDAGAQRFLLKRLQDAERFRNDRMRAIVEAIESRQPLAREIGDEILRPYPKDWAPRMASQLGCELRNLRKSGSVSVCVLLLRNTDVRACSEMLKQRRSEWGLPCRHSVEIADRRRDWLVDLIFAVWQAALSPSDVV